MIKLTTALLAVSVCCIISCNKKDQPLPTSDFREKYKGVFNITHRNIQKYYDDRDTTYYYQVIVDYVVSDSIWYLLPREKNGGHNLPAMRFRRAQDTSQYEKLGVDESGRIYRDPVDHDSENTGGFIGTDSLSHVSVIITARPIITDMMKGTRVQ
ncbi:hypothetical protein [Polluticoccus soli]|uniref:hypothetical protein n=1 Tax=Polluticoccus soli TaxID=3034150 RepID=UPI0023E2CAF0|nr:hypothetical protein [Flavipsychrobacter sp. JY13-12]